MNKKTKIDTFKYFIEEYRSNINGGGTFSLEELIELFKEYESPEAAQNLAKEAEYLNELLKKEDWEIDKAILDYVLKNSGRNNIKRIIKCLMEKL